MCLEQYSFSLSHTHTHLPTSLAEQNQSSAEAQTFFQQPVRSLDLVAVGEAGTGCGRKEQVGGVSVCSGFNSQLNWELRFSFCHCQQTHLLFSGFFPPPSCCWKRCLNEDLQDWSSAAVPLIWVWLTFGGYLGWVFGTLGLRCEVTGEKKLLRKLNEEDL